MSSYEGEIPEAVRKILEIIKNRAVLLKVLLLREPSEDLIIIFVTDNTIYVHKIYSFSIVNSQKVMVIMETPCQKIVWDLVPAIRASLAIELVKKGQSQAMSAKLLGIAPSAVSQYISGKRGYRIEFQGETKELIEKLAQDLIDNKVSDFVVRICDICVSARGIEKKCTSGCGPEE
jgi:predicted transcriptional regulator